MRYWPRSDSPRWPVAGSASSPSAWDNGSGSPQPCSGTLTFSFFDEPINGLDPQGILWVRHLLRSLADEGRTVLVSSHLMSEMALTADHLIIVGRGRLLATGSVADFIERSEGHHVRAVTPRR